MSLDYPTDGSTTHSVGTTHPNRVLDEQAPGYYRIKLGQLTISVVSDGTAIRDISEIMSKPEIIRRELTRAHLSLQLELSINTFVIDDGSQVILVDTGAGELFGPGSGGRLVHNLGAAGYAAEQIDIVLLTHIHADHSGGLSLGGERVFPNALVYVNRRDVDFWLSETQEARHPDRKRTFRQSHATVDPYVKSGQLRPFDEGDRLFPHICSVPAYGHTPGQTGYMIESEGQQLFLWGDTVHCVDVQMRYPDITIDYDVDRDEAIASRQTLLADMAERGTLVGGAHTPFPGLGYVRADPEGYSWIPRPYSSRP